MTSTDRNRSQYYLALRDCLLIQHNDSNVPNSTAFHFHDDYEIYLLLHGDAEFYVEQGAYTLHPGHLLVFNDCELHRVDYFNNGPWNRVAIHFDHRLVQDLSTPSTDLLGCFRQRKSGGSGMILLESPQISQMLTFVRRLEEASQPGAYGGDVLTVALLAELLVFVNGLFSSQAPTAPALRSGLIPDVMAYVSSHLSPDLTVQALTRQFSVDRYYLCHLFRSQTGGTLYQYILMKKIAVAKRYLLEGRSVMETCERAGFNDYNNFIRALRKLAGVSPGRYAARGRDVGTGGL